MVTIFKVFVVWVTGWFTVQNEKSRRALSYTDEELLADLRRVAVKHKSKSVSVYIYSIDGLYAGNTLIKRFGSWAKAHEMAGLVPRSPGRSAV